MPHSVVLYGKPGCCLCDDAREVVAAVRRDLPFDLEEVDVSIDPALMRDYGERIPVLELDGEALFEFRVDPLELRERLGTVTT
ncbi:MAG: glutaredoxin family protein [Thermoleophilaceae bacterium]